MMTLEEALTELRRRGLAAYILPDSLGVAIADTQAPCWQVTRNAIAHGLSIESAAENAIRKLDQREQ